MSDALPRWLDEPTSALHLTLRVDAFRRKWKAGTLPQPSYHLGARTPRWDRFELDAVMAASAASPRRQSLSEAVNAILSDGRARRKKAAGGRHGQGIPLRPAAEVAPLRR